MSTTSLVIPTRNAAATISLLLENLLQQTLILDEILILDSGSTDGTCEIAAKYTSVRVIPIDPQTFDHGGTRNWGLMQAIGDSVFFFTQDAIPNHKECLQNMLDFLQQNELAACHARQVARLDASYAEQLTREFNYPAKSNVRTANDINSLGIKAFFFSDAASVYQRAAYLHVGGFDSPIPTNEDMLIAWKLLHAGYKLGYCAEAMVTHSHTLRLRQNYQRNFDIGTALKLFEERFCGIKADSEGLHYARYVATRLLKKGKWAQCFAFVCECAVKLFANRAGKRCLQMSHSAVLKRTGNTIYWKHRFEGFR